MIYRCHGCQQEEARGCLPTTTCGLYAMALLALSTGCIAGVARGIRSLAGGQPPTVDPVVAPWWVGVLFGVLAVVVGVALALVGMIVINFVLELAEWLIFARRRCPLCNARRWSWGFTRGFGL